MTNYPPKAPKGRAVRFILLALLIVAAVVAFSAWITMLIAGGVFAIHHIHTPGYWETLGVAYLISWAGGLWNQTTSKLQAKLR